MDWLRCLWVLWVPVMGLLGAGGARVVTAGPLGELGRSEGGASCVASRHAAQAHGH